MIVHAFFLALGQIGDRRFRKVLLLGVGLTLALLIATTAGFVWLIETLAGETVWLPVLGDVTWLGDLLSVGSVLLMLVLSVFLMIPVASAITSMFLDEVAQAVEDRHYPMLPPAMQVSFGDALKDTVNFLGVLIAANLGALVVYLILTPVLPFAGPIIFYGMNGYLLGREYFTLAAMRRVGRDGARELRQRHSRTIWAAGVLMALPLSIPILNLVIPILGAATFTHIYHMLGDRRA